MSLESLVARAARTIRRAFGDDLEPVESEQTKGLPTSNMDTPADSIESREGRYAAHGYTFSTKAQARDFERRRGQPDASSAPPALPPARQPTPTQPSVPAVEVEAGIERTGDGRFRAGGYSFSDLDQARSFARRRSLTNADRAVESLRSARLVAEQRLAYASSKSGSPIAPHQGDNPSSAEIGRMSLRETTPILAATPQKTAVGSEQWVTHALSMRVSDIAFEAFLIYFGKPKNASAYPHSSLIDPTLPVGACGDPAGATLGYWPSYAGLDPRGRRTYLEWLTAGRPGGMPIGYVFLYFYGLERRLIVDRSEADGAAILGEVRRLLDLYDVNSSFTRYARLLLDVGSVIAREDSPPLRPTLDHRYSFELPLRIRIPLGERIAAGESLNADEALAWILALPDTYLRTAATRCFDELIDLWRLRFDQGNPEGLKIRSPKTRLCVRYQAAAGGYHADLSLDGVPDIAAVVAPVVRLREQLMACSDELDPLSRFLGREPDSRGTLACTTLLPADMLAGPRGEPLRQARLKLTALLGDKAIGRATLGETLLLVGLEWPIGRASLPVALQRQLAGRLDALDFGYEPDRRFGPVTACDADTRLSLFEAPNGGPIDRDNETYAAARILTEIAALAATADRIVVAEELASIEKHVLVTPGLSDAERLRLRAHAEAILDDPPKANAAIKRLAALPQAHRQHIIQAAVAAIFADGQVRPAEVKFLEGLHKALGLPREQVYGLLHRSEAERDAPVIVAPARPENGVALPVEAPASAFAIDHARLARIRIETSEVSSLLATIFIEDASPPLQADTQSSGKGIFDGLDAGHAKLLEELVRSPMERAAFDKVAQALKLLPSGALETINEWGFDRFDEPIVEDDDLILVPPHILSLLKMEAAL